MTPLKSNNHTSKKILITGSRGFIGSTISSFFKNRYTLYTPSSAELNLLDDKQVQTYFQKNPIDIVIHCAVIGGNRDDQYKEHMLKDNLHMFFNIVNCKKYFSRMINIGSGAVYDKRYDIRQVKESDVYKKVPVDDYGIYKYMCAQYIDTAIDMVDLRVFGIFGKGEDYKSRFISNIILKHIFDMSIVVNQNLYFDYIDVHDFIRIIEHFVHHTSKYHAYNIGTGIRRSLKSIAEDINELFIEKRKIEFKKIGLGHEYTCDISRLKDEIPNFKYTPFRKSLQDLIAWYKTQKDIIKRNDVI